MRNFSEIDWKKEYKETIKESKAVVFEMQGYHKETMNCWHHLEQMNYDTHHWQDYTLLKLCFIPEKTL